jgi:hypothetical protein
MFAVLQRLSFALLPLLASTLPLPAQPSAGKPWWQREPLRLVDLVTGMDGIDFRPPADVAARKAELLFNAEHLDVMGFVPGGMDDSRFFFRSQVGKTPQDYLAAYLPEARKRGIRVMIYFNVHWFTHEFGRRHPDWVQIREDGTPLDGIYDTGTSFCLNSPWRQWVFQVIRDLGKYPIDGIFFDGPVFFEKTCYCQSCRAKFRKLHGQEMPSKRSIKGRDFHELVEFQANSISEFLKDSNAIIKGINPQIAFYMNGGARGSNWATGRLNRIIGEHQDLLGSEGGFIHGDLTQIPLWKPGVTARLLETQAPDKPRVIFDAAAHKPWTYSVLPVPELRLLYADTIANAASAWFCMTPKELYQPEMDALRGMNAFVAKNGEFLLNTRSAARTAIVWSDTTANAYAGSGAQLIDINAVKQRSAVGSLGGEFAGLTDAIVRSHTPFDVIDDVTLEKEPLDRYRAIYLPNVACMSGKSAARLREYVRNGGNLFATFETSLYDEYGIRRQDFALGDLFGVASRNRIAGPRQWDAEKPVGCGPLMAGLEQRELLPSTLYYVQVRATAAQALIQYMNPMAGRYDGLQGVSADPALLVNRYGKGTVVYSAGDIGNVIGTYHSAEFYRLVENTLHTLAPAPVTVRNCPGSVELVLRSQRDRSRLMLHLVNFTGEMTRPIRNILPQRDIQVTLEAGANAKRIHTLMHPRELTIGKDERGRGYFTVPSVDEYEVVVIEQ